VAVDIIGDMIVVETMGAHQENQHLCPRSWEFGEEDGTTAYNLRFEWWTLEVILKGTFPARE